MKILITGSTGMIGQACVAGLVRDGHDVVRLVRGDTAGSDTASWNPDAGQLDGRVLANVEAVIHLSGENIAGGRWTPARKKRLLWSRIATTRLLCERIAECAHRPRVIICASAIGYYGDRPGEELREDSVPGRGFLADLCVEWEAAADPARAIDVRVVNMRTGVVLDSSGGALKKMLPPFRYGLGGVIGDGTQMMSWIALDDVVGAFSDVLRADDVHGAVNVVSPCATTNREFTHTLGEVLRRPTPLRIPASALRLALGEMADETLLASQNVIPAVLQQRGFQFERPGLRQALMSILR